MYYLFGSKYLVESLNANGFGLRIVRVRRYLTSTANHLIEKIQDGVYFPYVSQIGSLVQEDADQTDLNTKQ